MSEQIKKEDLNALNANDLKAECEKRGINHIGIQSRNKMIDAIVEYEADNKQTNN